MGETENTTEHADKQFLEYIVKSLVKHPDEVLVEKTLDERGVLLTINMNKSDIGTVVGKQGLTIGAMRRLMGIIGAKNKIMTSVRIHEDEPQERGFNPES